jgi:membrane-associated phospholipid phosphatase
LTFDCRTIKLLPLERVSTYQVVQDFIKKYLLGNFLNIDSETKNLINNKVIDNYSRLKPSLFLLPILFLISTVICIGLKGALSVSGYIQIQKEYFYSINLKLSQFPTIIYNLTQIGDTLIFLSLLTIFILYAPKIWESLIMATSVSAILSIAVKNLFLIPRPAAAFNHNGFVIIGEVLSGHNSLPSGHSITIFTLLTVLLFAFMPQKTSYKFFWSAFIFIAGLLLAFTRVGVGAHYPLDVIIGCTIGYISGLSGIFLNQKYKILLWIDNIKYYPIFILLLLGCCIVLADRIVKEDLIIYYLSLLSLVISILKITYQYAKK